MRRLVAALAVGFCALGAQAQTEIHPLSAAQSLACLVKPETPPRFPKANKVDKGFGAMRVLLKFTTADAAPTVEVLLNTAREDMQDNVFYYLRGYRLPCLTPKDGTVTAIQEFSFSNTDRDAVPLPPDRQQDGPPFCVVMPREAMFPPEPLGRPKVENVVVSATFTGDGTRPPEVELLYSTHHSKFEKAVRNYLAEYRMPCRTANQEPQSFQQVFRMVPAGWPRYGFKSEVFTLREFLGMTREPAKLRARYDFKTMGCPFKVRYTIYGGGMPNEAEAIGPKDPNKLPFLSWLASLNLALDEDQAEGLFGTTLQINIGCGSLNLGGED